MKNNEQMSFDELLKAACKKSLDSELEVLGEYDAEDYKVSEEAKNRFFRKLNYQLFIHSPFFAFCKKAAICAVVVLLLGAVVFTAEPVRSFFTAVYEKYFDNSYEIVFETSEETSAPSDGFKIILPTLPEGWTMESMGGSDLDTQKLTSPEGLIVHYVQGSMGMGIWLDDDENMTKEEITLESGVKAYLYTLSENFRVLIFVDEYIFTFTGRDVPRDVMIELANCIKK